MRTVIATLAVLALVPATAFADDSKTAAPRVVLTIDAPTATAADVQPKPEVQPKPQSQPQPESQPKPQSQPKTQDQPKTESQPKPEVAKSHERVAPQPNNGGYVVPESTAYYGGKIPEGAFIEKRPNVPLVATGLSIAGVSYVASVITAISACPPQSTCSSTSSAAWLYLPLVGPFVTAAMATSPGGAALAAFDGGLQVLGGALALAGVLAPRKFVVWQDKSASLKITPTAGATPMVGEAKPAMSAGISLTLTHL